jgi:type I restriction enzyme M protein
VSPARAVAKSPVKGRKAVTTKEVIDRIFKEPGIKFELTEFENLGKPVHDILTVYPKTASTGKDAGKTKYYLKSFIPFSTGNEEVQIYAEGGKSAPEEIVRQLWAYKLIHQYNYKIDEIDLEKGVQFGTEVGTKAADIIVYTDSTKLTPKIIVECKKPKRKDGIEQLKSYMNAKGAPVAVWSNGADNIILYRPYPAQFDDTLFDIPKRGQEPKDVLEASKTLLQLKRDFNFKKIIQDLEELVLADSGKDEFNEIFKLIFAKIWDEKEASEKRPNKVVEFRKAIDPDITYDRINNLFHKACEEWPGIFKEGDDIDLAKRHLQVCVGPIEGVRLMGSNLRIMDDAFEYLLPTEAKKKKGAVLYASPRCRDVRTHAQSKARRVHSGSCLRLRRFSFACNGLVLPRYRWRSTGGEKAQVRLQISMGHRFRTARRQDLPFTDAHCRGWSHQHLRPGCQQPRPENLV